MATATKSKAPVDSTGEKKSKKAARYEGIPGVRKCNRAMSALAAAANSDRIAILVALRREGDQSSEELSAGLGARIEPTLGHLEALKKAGLVLFNRSEAVFCLTDLGAEVWRTADRAMDPE